MIFLENQRFISEYGYSLMISKSRKEKVIGTKIFASNDKKMPKSMGQLSFERAFGRVFPDDAILSKIFNEYISLNQPQYQIMLNNGKYDGISVMRNFMVDPLGYTAEKKQRFLEA